MNDAIGGDVSRAALEALGVPGASLDAFISPGVRPNGAANGSKRGNGHAAASGVNDEVAKQQWVTLPISGRKRLTDDLVETDEENGIYLDPDREGMWKRSVIDNDGGKKVTFTRIKKPVPILHEIIRPIGPGLREPDGNEATYRISVAGYPEVDVISVGGKALHEGTCWRDHWADLGNASRSDFNFLERITQLQARPFKVPNHAWPRHTGFFEKPVGGWIYILPDGRQLSSDGVVTGHVAGYNFKRTSEWRGYHPTAPEPAEDEISGLLAELVEIDPKGRLLAQIGHACRGLVGTIEPVRESTLSIGDARSGKTSGANFARGVIGPCGPGEPRGGKADATFGDTITITEIKLDALRDVPILVDDARKRTGGSSYETAETTKTLEKLITSAAQDEPIRDRSNSSLGQPRSATVKGALMMTAERSLLGKIDDSRLLRTVLLIYELGEIDHETLRSEWQRLQSPITTGGLAITRAVLRALRAHARHEIADAIAKADETFEDWIRKGVSAAMPNVEPEFIASLAMRWSRVMTGMLLLDRACGFRDYPACNALAPHILPLIRAQIDFISEGGGSGIDRQFVLGAIRWAFAHGAYLLGPDGRPATEMAPPPGNILARGYGWREGAIALTGNRLIGRYANRGGEYLITDVLFDYARDYARNIGRELPLTPKTFPAAVVDLGLAQPRAGLNAPRVRIGGRDGERYYALFIGSPLETDGTHGTHAENDSDINVLTVSHLPDLRGILREVDGTHFCKTNQHVIECVPCVPSVLKVHTYREPCLDKAAEEQKIRSANFAPETPVEHFGFSTKPRLAAALRNPVGPCCPLRRPGKAQEGRTPAQAPIPPPAPSKIASEAPRPAASPRERWPERAAAADAERLCLLQPDGSIEPFPLPDALKPESASIGQLAAFAIERRITQLWLHPSWTALSAAPPRMTASEARDGVDCAVAGDGALPAGWRSGSPGKLKAWNRITNASQEIHLIASAFDLEWPFGAAKDAAALLVSIASFRGATGGFWPLIHPAVTAEKMLRALHRDGLDLSASIAPSGFEPMRAEVTSECWLRPLSENERRPGGFVLGLDKSATHLAAMSSLSLGFGEPSYVAAPAFDARKAGYWRGRVIMPASWPKDFPPIGNPKRDLFVTPTLAFAAQHGAKIEPEEAWLFPETHRPFEPFYNRLKTGRSKLLSEEGEASLAFKAIKSLSARIAGNLAGRTKRASEAPVDLYRPDWRHFIMATAQANILRNIAKAGLRPFGVRTDAIYLIADSPDPALGAPGLKFGREPGSWRPIGAMPIDRLPAVYRDKAPRSPALLLDKLTALLKEGGDAA